MATTQFLFSGFGGQGILFAGKFVAYKGLTEDKQVSWLPSYGPEMRGGTASCSVIISDEPVGSPIVSAPDVLVALNLPSLDKFENAVKPGGYIFADSTLIYIPATQLASDNGIPTLANMIVMGKMLKELGDFTAEGIENGLAKVISAKRADMKELNIKALELGANS